jgi:hypothetical protein
MGGAATPLPSSTLWQARRLEGDSSRRDIVCHDDSGLRMDHHKIGYAIAAAGAGLDMMLHMMPELFPVSHIVREVLFGIGAAMFIGGLGYALAPLFVRFALPSRSISLHDAAVKLYEAMKGTDVGRMFDRHTGATPEELLDGVGHHIVEHCPLEVKRPPSTKWEPLPRDERNRLMARSGATGLGYVESADIRYPEVRLNQGDLKRLIKEYKADARP